MQGLRRITFMGKEVGSCVVSCKGPPWLGTRSKKIFKDEAFRYPENASEIKDRGSVPTKFFQFGFINVKN